jgi:hypothetical protein
VGFGEVGGEDVDGVTAKVCHLGVEARDLGGGLLILARTSGATSPLALEPTQFAKSVLEGSGVIEFAYHLGSGSNRCQSPHTHVDADSRVALGNTGLLGANDTHPHGRDNSLSLARDRDSKDLGSIECDQAFDESGVFVRAQGPEYRQGQVAPVSF